MHYLCKEVVAYLYRLFIPVCVCVVCCVLCAYTCVVCHIHVLVNRYFL